MKPRPDDVHEEPSLIPVEDEMHMDLYNPAMVRCQNNMGRGLNYENMPIYLLFHYLQISRSDGYPTSYPHIPSWDELWSEMQCGDGGSGAERDDDD